MRGKMKKPLILFIVVLCGIFVFAKITEACEGARPLAMGGAFTGLADDANATYWNPAALGLMTRPEVTYTGTVYDRDALNYDDWVSFVLPLNRFSKNKNSNLGTIGLSFMNNVDKGKYSYIYYGIDINVEVEVANRWYTLSYGRELTELSHILEGLCIGFNLRCKTFEETLKAQATVGGTTYSADASDDDSTFALDLALYDLWKWQDFSIGVLFQNINEPDLTLFGETAKYKVNIRPGAAYRAFDGKLILSCEIYDVTNNNSYRNLRVGAEGQITDMITLRAGGYDVTATEKTGRAITGGIGIISKKIKENIDLDFSYTVLYWYESKADAADKLSHMLSLSTKF